MTIAPSPTSHAKAEAEIGDTRPGYDGVVRYSQLASSSPRDHYPCDGCRLTIVYFTQPGFLIEMPSPRWQRAEKPTSDQAPGLCLWMGRVGCFLSLGGFTCRLRSSFPSSRLGFGPGLISVNMRTPASIVNVGLKHASTWPHICLVVRARGLTQLNKEGRSWTSNVGYQMRRDSCSQTGPARNTN